MSSIHKVQRGKVERMSFGKIKDILQVPYLIEVQKKSYENFLSYGIKEVLDDFSPISDTNGKLELKFLEHTMGSHGKYTINQCKNNSATYEIPLRVKLRLENKETGHIIDSPLVFMGELPKMTENGTFIINGSERVVVSQLTRSPGVNTVINEKFGFDTSLHPYRGAWLEFMQDVSNSTGAVTLSVRVDRNKKITATLLLRALGYGSNESLAELFNNDPIIAATCAKDGTTCNSSDAKRDIYYKLKQGEQASAAAFENHLSGLFFDTKKYDLNRVGRYKYNHYLGLANRIEGLTAAEDVIFNGEVLVEAGGLIDIATAKLIQNTGMSFVNVELPDGKVIKIIGNSTVELSAFIDCDPKTLGILENVYFPNLKPLLEEYADDMNGLKQAIKENAKNLVLRHITLEDIVAAISYNLNIKAMKSNGLLEIDNIDHLSNRRVRAVGELLQNQFRTGMARLERVVKEKMNITDLNEVTPQNLINIRPVSAIIKEFFGSSQLSQFMDQPNPIAELTHKRKLSALGPGGLNRERAGFEVRDVHHTHYGRMCPIETPEGQNIGLITSLSSYARVNEYGFIEAPYRKVDKATGIVTEEIVYLDACQEDKYIVAQANEPLSEDGHFVHKRVTCRCREDIKEYRAEEIDFMDVSPQQLVSIAASLIPFLENDDANRALMGSNMQRQAVPLIKPEAPVIGTGMEYKVAHDSGVCVISGTDGVVTYVSADKIEVTDGEGFKHLYELSKFNCSNQGTCINQKTLVRKGDLVKKDDILADGPSTEQGELALGRNILIGFMTWEGYNYEDAILISEDIVKEDVFTSIHIEKYELECRDTKLGEESITRDIPNVGEDMLKNLDADGVIVVGSEVHSGDYLVGKVAPKGETEPTPEERLLKAIFGDKAREVRDVSLKVPNGSGGIVVDVKTFTREDKCELSPGVNKQVRVYIAQKRKIGVGDKMAGRHGNKGVISRVLPREDMPFMADGTPLQIVLNPLGVPSRMNIGQVLEVHLGLVAKMLGIKVATPVFDGATEHDIKELFENNNLPNNGKIQLYDGRTGEPFENPVTVGYMYMLKLIHLVDDKIHARSVGPYSLVTQQPLGGKAQFGGQRFGEMEVWALEAYGAANILQEVLTVKSDDVMGRQKIFDSIMKQNVTAEPGLPEAFKVLKKEMQSLCLDMRLLNEGSEEVNLGDNYDDEKEFVSSATKSQEDIVDIFGNTNGDTYDQMLFSDSESDLVDGDDIMSTFAGFVGGDFDINEVDKDELFEDDVDSDLDDDYEPESSYNEVEALLQGEFDDDDANN